MGKLVLIYLKLRKLWEYLFQIYSKLMNRNIDTANISLNVSSLTRILMINFPTSSWVHTFKVEFTVIFT